MKTHVSIAQRIRRLIKKHTEKKSKLKGYFWQFLSVFWVDFQIIITIQFWDQKEEVPKESEYHCPKFKQHGYASAGRLHPCELFFK